MNFGVKLKELRTEKKLTQLQMAEILETSKSNISKYEAGSVEPNLDTLLKISNFFGVPVDYILGNDNYNIDYTNNQTNTSLDIPEPPYEKIETPPTPLTEREQNIIDIFRNLTDDNKDIIVGELKKTLRDQRRYEKDEPINYSKSDYDSSYKSLHREMRKAYLEDSANKNEVS